MQEDVWEASIKEDADAFLDKLRSMPEVLTQCLPASEKEVSDAAANIKGGRRAGADGVRSDLIHALPCLNVVMHLLVNLILRSSLYPSNGVSALLGRS